MEIIHTIPQFYFSHSTITLPIYPATLALFVAYMFDRDHAPSAVNTYVSSLKLLSQTIWFTRSDASILHCSNVERPYGKEAFV